MSAFAGFRLEQVGAMGLCFSLVVWHYGSTQYFSTFLASYLPLLGCSVLFSAVEVVRHPIHSLFFAYLGYFHPFERSLETGLSQSDTGGAGGGRSRMASKLVVPISSYAPIFL